MKTFLFCSFINLDMIVLVFCGTNEKLLKSVLVKSEKLLCILESILKYLDKYEVVIIRLLTVEEAFKNLRNLCKESDWEFRKYIVNLEVKNLDIFLQNTVIFYLESRTYSEDVGVFFKFNRKWYFTKIFDVDFLKSTCIARELSKDKLKMSIFDFIDKYKTKI